MSPSIRFLLTVVIFAVVMPGLPIAVLMLLSFPIFAYSATSLFKAWDIFGVLIAFGYGGGLTPAATVGAVVGLRDQREGASAGYATLAGLVGGLVFVGLIVVFAFDASIIFLILLVAVLIVSALGALLAWRLTRLLAPAKTAA